MGKFDKLAKIIDVHLATRNNKLCSVPEFFHCKQFRFILFTHHLWYLSFDKFDKFVQIFNKKTRLCALRVMISVFVIHLDPPHEKHWEVCYTFPLQVLICLCGILMTVLNYTRVMELERRLFGDTLHAFLKKRCQKFLRNYCSTL